jgi:hypothetical protein
MTRPFDPQKGLTPMEKNPCFPKVAKQLKVEDPPRSFWCKKYDVCLSKAAFANSGLDCSECQNRYLGASKSGNVTRYQMMI